MTALAPIPRLAPKRPTADVYRAFLKALPSAGFRGELAQDEATRVTMGTDNSVYQVLPQAVAYPVDADDMACFAAVAARQCFETIDYSVRGGGTGTNGQSLTDGVVVDVSRHMNSIIETNLEAGWVRVEPGVVLDQLNAHLVDAGVFFAPNLSPSSRATIGGMIATDACGKGSRVHGRTSEHLLALTTVLSDGSRFTSRPLSDAELDAVCAQDDLAGAIHRTLRGVLDTHGDLIQRQFPKLRRFMTGYNLARLRRADGHFDLNSLIAGSEGTLGVVVEARLRLTPIATASQLVLLRYDSFEDALGSAELIAKASPSSIETVDETVIGLSRKDMIWHAVGALVDPDDGESTPVRAVNLVEFSSNDADDIQRRVDALLASVEAGRGTPNMPMSATVAKPGAETAALWSLRKKGVGLLGNMPGRRKPVAFVEDTVVPPERLREYVAGFRAILDAEGVTYGMFGHVDVGCLHVRPALDMTDPEDEARLRRISDKVCDLVQSFGGVIWGEHGKGYRSEYNPRFFGRELYTVLCEVKAVFDPRGQLNPGKLAVPKGSGRALVSVDGPTRGQKDRQIPADVRTAFSGALDCNGNGVCFDWNPDHVICPSSKITRDRVHSPKGRAGLMREWLRLLSQAGMNPAAPKARSAWLAPFAAIQRLWRSGTEGDDWSHQVYAGMDGCLACKACATDCPIHVDVPAFRADFLSLYHTRYRRPLSDHLVAGLEGVLAWAGRVPKLANALSQAAPARWVLARVGGLVDAPRLHKTPLKRVLKSRGQRMATPAVLAALSDKQRASAVIIIQDAFTSFFDTQVLEATLDVLDSLGFLTLVAPWAASGKALHIKGFLGRFRRLSKRNRTRLEALSAHGIPLVCVEPAVALAFNDEVREAAGGGAYDVQLVQRWLASQDDLVARASGLRRVEAPGTAGDAATPFQLFGHCTERTADPKAMAAWTTVFDAMGAPVAVEEVGCCGMCGVFGMERRHAEESKGIFAMSWAKKLPQSPDARAQVLATGHSCRHQVARCEGFEPKHPMEALSARIAATAN